MKKSLFYLFILVSTFISFSCSSMVEDMKNLSKSSPATAYVVENFFEAVKSNDYDASLTLVSEPEEGSTDDVEAEVFEGFYLADKVIEENDSYPDASVKAIVKFYYKRNIVNLSFDPDGGYLSSSSAVYSTEGKYGEKIPGTFETPVKSGYEFAGWYDASDPEKNIIAVPSEFPAAGIELKAAWNESGSFYTVKFEYENLSGKYEILYTKEKGGQTDSAVELTQDEIEEQNIEGFTYSGSESTDISELKISGDGSTVVEVKYTRNSYTLTLKPNGGIWSSDSSAEDKTQTVKYGEDFSNITIEEITHSNTEYGFVKWYQEGDESSYVPETMPAGNLTLVAQWANPYAEYKAEYYFESLLEEGKYNVDANLTLTLNAKIGGMSEARPLSSEALKSANHNGYSYSKTEQTTVLEDGSSVAKVYYDRSVVTVKYETAGGFWDGENGTDSEERTYTGKFGSKIDTLTDKPSKALYSFNGWYLNGSANEVTVLPDSIPAENVTYIAGWKKTGALYSVSFWFEKVDSTDSADYENNYEMDPERTFTDGTEVETKILSAAYGNSTSAHNVIDTVEGFTAFNAEEVTVADGSEDLDIEVKVYYKRNLVTFTFNLNDTVSQNVTSKGKYEAEIKASDIPEPVRADYEFTGWKLSGSDSLITDIPSEYSIFTKDTIFYAQWNYTGTDYSIKYLFEDTTGTVDSAGNVTAAGNYAESTEMVSGNNLTTKGNGQSGTTTNVTAPEIEGFEDPEITQITIGSESDVTVKYTRKVTSFQFDANGGKWSDDSEVKTVYGKYGASAELSGISSPEKTFATFAGWYVSGDETATVIEPLPVTFQSSGVIYKAKWTARDTSTSNGTGEYANQDITLTASGTGTTRTFTATVPYGNASEWTFVWYLDNTVQSGTFENSGDSQTFTTATLSSGNHTVRVFAYMTDNEALVLNKSVSVTIE